MSRRRGFILIVVIFFVVLLFSGVATFLRRATLDSAIVRNRDYATRAEALARGGVRLGIVLLQQDRLEEQAQRSPPIDSPEDLWALADQLTPGETEDGGTLRIHIEDAGARIPLNGLVPHEGAGDDGNGDDAGTDQNPKDPKDKKKQSQRQSQGAGGQGAGDSQQMINYVKELLTKVIAEMPGRPEDKPYDPEELAHNLIDFIDEDDLSDRGEPEDAWYEQQDPPYKTPKDHVFFSVDELALVKGFDPDLVEALRPYVSAYPLAGGGVNPNTAPPWVLATLDTGGPVSERTGHEDFVKRVVKCRGELPLCPSGEGCQQISECVGTADVTPPFAFQSEVFTIQASARYGDVTRTIEAVVNRKELGKPRILSWHVR